MDVPPKKRAAPRPGRATTYRGQHDMAEWWQWSMQVEEESLPLYQEFIRPGDLVFDIGANRGRKVYCFLKLGARVVAVEPLFAFGNEFVPEFYWKWGKDKRVMQVDRAVTSERTVEISINRFMPYVSSIDREWMTESAHAPKNGQPYYREGSIVKRQVRGITIDGLIGIYGMPKFVKVDVEGHENQAIATLSMPVPALNMEFHRDWIPLGAIKHMDGLGSYEWNYALDHRGEFVGKWGTREQLLAELGSSLTKEGAGSWGDIYGRLVD